jgi:hypothetical protein
MSKVKRIAKTRSLQQAWRHRKQCCTMVYPDYPVSPVHETAEWRTFEAGQSLLNAPLPRPPKYATESGPVDVYVELTYPFTDAVPEDVRTKNFKAETVGDLCREIRAMYQTIYAEDERLGGPGSVEVDVDHGEFDHIEKMRSAGHNLLNRKSGPWVWGHDMEDLVIEILDLKWLRADHAHVQVFIGS